MRDLVKWRGKRRRKPLLLRGARQVGKTWILKKFAGEEFEDFVYLICDKKNDALVRIFDGTLDPERIIHLLEIEAKQRIVPGKTLLIIDEIQEIPRALESLKYFCENAPEYEIVAAGSLMGIALHEGTSFPVGKVDELFLYPLSFEEFLTACGEDELRGFLEKKDHDSIQIFAEKYKELLKTYYLVGGMPEAVDAFAQDGDLGEVREIQKGLLDFYDNDFSKRAPADQIIRIRAVWGSLLKQLSKENRKFVYGLIRTGSRAREYELAINWLEDYGIIYIILNYS